MYEMLTGSPPFVAASATGLAQQHVEKVPPDLSSLLPAGSPVLEQVILKVLSKEPSLRYRTADQLGRVLQRVGADNGNVSDDLYLNFLPETIERVEQTVGNEPTDEETIEIDWISVVLGLLALIMVGGLIPFWVWVYFVYNPPIR
jgi:serine/threonine-protein kinase